MPTTLSSNRIARPLLRYFGGKWRLTSWIIGIFPEHTKYVEPYGGGASVLLCKSRVHTEIYNDLDSEVFNLLSVVRNNSDELRKLIELTPFSRNEFELAYTPSENAIEQARRTLVRSAMGFASQASLGQRSGFLSAFKISHKLPAHRWTSLSPVLLQISQRIQGVILENRDALSVMRQHDCPSTLHYVDPPYVPDSRSGTYKKVYRHEMSMAQHAELLHCLKGLKGAVVLSGYANELYAEHLTDWTTLTCQTQAGGKQSCELNRQETLWLKPASGHGSDLASASSVKSHGNREFKRGKLSTGKGSKKTTGKRLGKSSLVLLGYLKKKPSMTTIEMAAKLGLTEDGVNYQLTKLKASGCLQRVGGRKFGSWQVV